MKLTPEGVDPQLSPEFIEAELCAKAKGFKRRLCKLSHRKADLLTELRLLHEETKTLQARSIEAEKALFEHRGLIETAKPKLDTVKKKPKPLSESQVDAALNSMTPEDRAKMIQMLLAKTPHLVNGKK